MIKIANNVSLGWIDAIGTQPEDRHEQLVFSGSMTALFDVFPVKTGLPFCKKKVTYRMLTELKNPSTGVRIGREFPTMAEAKARAEELARQILSPTPFCE